MALDNSYKITALTGKKGDTGIGIKSITEYYLVSSSSSGITTSTSGWTTTVQTPTAEKKYLWNYEKITYTDNTTNNTAPAIIGNYSADGKNGSNGKGIKSITEYYLATSSTNVSTSTSGWTTTVQTITADKKYLWNYEVIVYTDDSTTITNPVIIGSYGDKGAPGEDAPNLKTQYSANNSNWHDTFATSDKYMRTSSDDGATWSGGIKIVGEDGKNGTSPKITTSKNGSTTTITITDADGTKTATINDGTNGTSLTSKGNWASNSAYKLNDFVYYTADKNSYVCKKAHTSSSSIVPTNTTYWALLSKSGTDGKSATQYYIHYVYCDDTANGTNYSTSETRKYIGTYTDTSQADATTFATANAKSGIVWSKITGEDGEDGESAVSVHVGNDSITLQCNSDGKLKSALSTTIKVGAYKGTTRIPCTITATKTGSVVLGTITNGTSSADGTILITQTANSAGTAGNITLTITADGAGFVKIVEVGIQKDGATGQRGGRNLSITTAPSAYTTKVGNFTPAYRIALSTVKTQSGIDTVYVGDTLVYGTYRYPIGYVATDYVYTADRTSVKGDSVNPNLQDGNKDATGCIGYTNFADGVFRLDNAKTSENYIFFPTVEKKVENGKTYTISFEAKANENLTNSELYFLANDFTTTGYITNKYIGSVPSTWTKYSHTFTITEGKTLKEIRFRLDNNGSKTAGKTAELYIKNVKLEEGNVATAFIYSSEDSIGARGAEYRGSFSSAPTSNLADGDWYLKTGDGFCYYYSKTAGSWTKITDYNDYRYQQAMNDMINLSATLQSNANLNTAKNTWVKNLCAGNALIDNLFSKSITVENEIKSSSFSKQKISIRYKTASGGWSENFTTFTNSGTKFITLRIGYGNNYEEFNISPSTSVSWFQSNKEYYNLDKITGWTDINVNNSSTGITESKFTSNFLYIKWSVPVYPNNVFYKYNSFFNGSGFNLNKYGTINSGDNFTVNSSGEIKAKNAKISGIMEQGGFVSAPVGFVSFIYRNDETTEVQYTSNSVYVQRQSKGVYSVLFVPDKNLTNYMAGDRWGLTAKTVFGYGDCYQSRAVIEVAIDSDISTHLFAHCVSPEKLISRNNKPYIATGLLTDENNYLAGNFFDAIRPREFPSNQMFYEIYLVFTDESGTLTDPKGGAMVQLDFISIMY